MDRDAITQCGDKLFIFAHIKSGQDVQDIKRLGGFKG